MAIYLNGLRDVVIPVDSVGSPEIIDGSVDVVDLGPGVQSEFVNEAGDTMTGLLTLSGAPTTDLHAATKKYVDDSVGGVDLSSRVAVAGDTMTGNLNMGGNSVLNAANLMTTNTSQINMTGSKEFDPSGNWQWKGTFGGAPKEFSINPAGNSWAVQLTRFGSPAWRISGTGMENYGLTRLYNGGIDLLRSISAAVTGQINMGARASATSSLITSTVFGAGGNVAFRASVDGFDIGDGTAPADTSLKRTAPNEWSIGVTDHIKAPNAPTVNEHLANKQYVDGAVSGVTGFVQDTGDTMTGDLVLSGNTDIVFDDNSRIEALTGTLTGVWLRSKATADAADRLFIERGGQFNWGPGNAGADVTLERTAANTLGLGAGDQLQVLQDPVANDDVTRKSYVDNAVSGLSGTYVDEAGDTMTGNLVMSNFADISLGLGSQIQHLNANSPGSDWVRVNATTDTDDRFRMTVAGTMRWGDGSAAADVLLERGGADYLRMGSGDQLRVQQDPVNDDDVARKAYVDAEIAAADTTNVQQYVTANGTTAVSATARTVVVNQPTPGAATIELPASPAAGRKLDINKRSASGGGNVVTVSGNGKNINGVASQSLNPQYDSITVEYSADVDEWMIL